MVALSLLQIGIKHVGASTAAILITEPITSIICGVLLLGENSDYDQDAACALIMTGVVTLSLAKQKKASGRGSYRSGRLINLSKPTIKNTAAI